MLKGIRVARCNEDIQAHQSVAYASLGPNQRLALLARGFDFYADQPNKERAAHLLELIESNGDKGLLRECRRKYAIVFENKRGYITEMEQALAKASGQEASRLSCEHLTHVPDGSRQL